jgi:VWFA-related protein
MLRCARFVPFFALAAVSGLGQTAQPAPPAPARSAPSLNAPAPVATIKARAQLVILDVVVTNSHHQAVHNLKAADFSVLENNAPQQITSFEEHAAIPPVQAAKIARMPTLPRGIFTNFTPTPPDSAVNVLLLDSLNTQMKDQAYVREQVLDFLKNTPPGTRIAVFALNGRLAMLQGFTSDVAALKASVSRNNMSIPAILPGSSTGDDDPVGNGGGLSVTKLMGGVGGADIAQLMGNIRKSGNGQTADDMKLRVQITLEAMNQLARYLGGIPGRKNLIWFSGSFPVLFDPETEGRYRDTANLLARSRVAVYPIAAAGLRTTATPISNGSPSGRGAAGALSAFAQASAGLNSDMERMAADTGGQAYLDANGLSQAVTMAIDNGSNYYTLAYTPTDSQQIGDFHKIQVKLAQQGFTLAYRKGYYADDARLLANRRSDDADSPVSGRDALARAMMRGAPDATEILLKLQVVPASAATETAPVKGNIVNPNPASKFKIQGPYHRYAIDVAADARDIKITPTPEGHYQFSTELITYIYDASGAVINVAAQKARGNLSLSNYANLRHVGLQFHQEISVPVGGEYFLRTSLRDLETDRYGSVEIPVASVANLAPLTAAATAAPASTLR